MHSFRFKAILLVLLLPLLGWSRDPFYTIGPMFHFNFGGGKTAFSMALEWAYWSWPSREHYANEEGPTYGIPEDGLGYGFDMGAEWELHGRKSKFRFYTEPQIALDGIRGLSLGPVLEIPLGPESMHAGIQASGWFLWGDLRLRYIDDKTFFCPGLFVKIPYSEEHR